MAKHVFKQSDKVMIPRWKKYFDPAKVYTIKFIDSDAWFYESNFVANVRRLKLVTPA